MAIRQACSITDSKVFQCSGDRTAAMGNHVNAMSLFRLNGAPVDVALTLTEDYVHTQISDPRASIRLMEPKEFMTDVDTGNSEEYSSGLNTPGSQSQASPPPPDLICGNCSFQTSNPVREDPEGMEEQGGSSLSPHLDPLPSSMETLTSEISMLALQSPSIPTDQPPFPHPHLEQEPDSDPDSSRTELSGSGSNSVVPWRLNSLEEDSCTAVDLSKLPAELKEDFFDGVIIHHEDDLQLAERVKKELVSLQFENGLTPKIALENECTSSGRTELYNFGKWFSKATWIFLLITHRFCHPNSDAESYKTAVSLTESYLYPIEKKHFVVPIFILNKKCDPIVPACLRVLSGVNCNSSGSMTDEDKSRMKRTLGSRIQERQMKEIEQKGKQTDFLQRKKELEL